jgi:hypothetical protein
MVDSAASQVTRPFFKITCFTRRAFASIRDVLDRAVRSSWLVDHSRTLHHFLTCCTIHVVSVGSEFRWGKRFDHKTQIRSQTSSRRQVYSVVDTAHQLIPCIASDRLCYLLPVSLTTSANSYRKMEVFRNTELQDREPRPACCGFLVCTRITCYCLNPRSWIVVDV